MRVLVVEDDRTIASFVVAGLRQAGFAVDHAVNAEAALELTQTEPHDAAIVDIMLPGDGLAQPRRSDATGQDPDSRAHLECEAVGRRPGQRAAAALGWWAPPS